MTARSSLALRWIIRVGLALLVGLLLFDFAKMMSLYAFIVRFPYGMDYGEGIVWQQMRNIVAGQGYTPIGVYPAIVYHYPPVYHLVSAAVARFGGLDELMAGRLVSALATLVMMALTGALTASAIPRDEGRFVRWTAGLVAGLSLVLSREVLGWGALMRVDMLSYALTLGGLWLSIYAVRRPSMIVLAAIAFVLAVYTRQTSIAAPAAAFVGLLLVRPRLALMLTLLCVAMGLTAMIILSVTTHGGFLRHTIAYNINRFDPSHVMWFIYWLGTKAILLAVVGLAAGIAWLQLRSPSSETLRQRIAMDSTKPALLILLIFLILKTMMLPMVLKSGASENYFIEWLCAAGVFVGLGVAPLVRIAAGGAVSLSPALLGIAVLTLVALPVRAVKIPRIVNRMLVQHHSLHEEVAMLDRIRAARKPVISDDMVLLIRAGRPVMWEPAIAAELGHDGRYDEKAFAAMVRRQDFAFFITDANRGETLFDQRYNPIVVSAMEQAYQSRQTPEYVLHLPRAAGPR